jgi:hypothetical protein
MTGYDWPSEIAAIAYCQLLRGQISHTTYQRIAHCIGVTARGQEYILFLFGIRQKPVI